ncbi:MAG: serine hydrolase domain-containing protein [Cyclobacteriaceae bacterium]
MLTKIYAHLWAVLFLTVLLACSTDDEPVAPDSQPPIEEEIPEAPSDPLAIQLDTRLNDKVMGFAYVILRDGEVAFEGTGGLARNTTDGERAMSTEYPMHIASVSKWVTTLTTLSILEENDISSNTSVAPYFPVDWTLGPGIETLTFMDLLAQRGGFNQYGSNSFNANRYDSLKQIVESGAEGLRLKLYNNNHHALFRVILPVLNDQLNNQEGQYTPAITGLAYETVVKETLFDPLQLEADLTASSVSNTIKAYANKADTGGGSGSNVDFTEVGAAYGWHISVADLAEVWRAAWYTDIFINEGTRTEMTSNTAGLFETRDGLYGRYFMKDGAWWYSNQPQRQLQTIIAHFPDDTDVIIFINSALDSNGWLGSVVIEAYEDSRLPG